MDTQLLAVVDMAQYPKGEIAMEMRGSKMFIVLKPLLEAMNTKKNS